MMNDVLSFGSGALLETMPAHWEENYLGVWAVQDEFLRSFVSKFGNVDIPVHIQANATEIRAEMERIKGGYDVEIKEGIAIVTLAGTTSKHYNSFTRSTSTLMMRKTLRSLRRNEEVRGVMLYIDSPGGAVAGQKAFADEIAALASEKPTYAFIEDMGCSAAYWSASQTSRIYANDMAVIGSIGTYGVVYDASKMAENEGIKVHVIRAGKWKGAGVTGTEISDEHLAKLQDEVNVLNEFFIEAVANRRLANRRLANGRGLSVEQVRSLATGDVWIGETAVAAGLVDGIGTLDDAVVALANEILANEVNATAQPNRMTNMSQKDGKKMSEEILESRVAELQAELEAERIARETAVAQVAELEHEARFQRFEKLIGMGESAWAGERGVHLQMLMVLADAKGEGSDEFVAYVQQQNGLTAQLVDSVLFAEMGSGQRDGNGDAAGKLEAQANMLAQEKGLTYEQAYALVLEGNPALYAAYQKEGV